MVKFLWTKPCTVYPIFGVNCGTKEDLKIGQIGVGVFDGWRGRRGDLDFNDMVAKSSASATYAVRPCFLERATIS